MLKPTLSLSPPPSSLFLPGGPGVVSDPRLQAGAAAAAPTADGAAGEPRRSRPAGQEHQHHASHHHCHPGVCLHRRQVCCAAHEEPPSCVCHRARCLLPHLLLEELGAAAAHHRHSAGSSLTAVKVHEEMTDASHAATIGCTIVAEYKLFFFLKKKIQTEHRFFLILLYFQPRCVSNKFLN